MLRVVIQSALPTTVCDSAGANPWYSSPGRGSGIRTWIRVLIVSNGSATSHSAIPATPPATPGAARRLQHQDHAIIHGEADRIVPISHGKKLAEKSFPKATLVEIPEGRHNDSRRKGLALEALKSFIEEVTKN